MKLVRTYVPTGATLEDSPRTMRDAEQRVAWTATDNLAMSRKDASRQAALAARSFAAGEPFDLGDYRFVLDRSPT